MIKITNSLFFLFVAFVCLESFAKSSYSGFVKLRQLSSKELYEKSKSLKTFQINRLSLNHKFSESIYIEGSYELLQLYSTNHLSLDDNVILKRQYRVLDLNMSLLNSGNNYALLQNLDRLLLNYFASNYTLTIGRQQIAFGNARITNPTDVFSPFSYMIIDKEVRNGVDAIRLIKELDENSELDLGIIFGDNAKKDKSGIYALLKLSLDELEFSPMLAYFNDATMLGLDFSYPFFGALLWLEGAWINPKEEKPYTRLTLGGERLLNDKLFFIGEYHFNGAGQSDSNKYDSFIDTFAFKNLGVFLKARHYLDLVLTYQIHPLHSLITSLKSNLNDKSFYLAADWNWNTTQNSYFGLGSMIGVASDSSATSEFNSDLNILYARLSYYF